MDIQKPDAYETLLPLPHAVWVVPHEASSLYASVFPLPLAGIERISHPVNISNVFPGRLDEQHLITAFRKALAYYPHANGRLRVRSDDWSLDAGKRGVPIVFDTMTEPLNHYQSPSFMPPKIMDLVCTDIAGADQSDWDEPMLRAKVTYCPKTNETWMGWSSNHMIGDGQFVYQFLCAWSQYYQDKEPCFGPPTYEKYRTAPSVEHNDNADTAAFIDRHLPHLKELYPIEEFTKMAGAAYASTTLVDLLFTPYQIQQLRAVADSWPGREGFRTSAHDAISGYLIATMNRCLEKPITCVASVLSYRGVKNPDYLKPGDWRAPGLLAVGNPVLQVPTPTLSRDEACSIGALAAAIHKSIKDATTYEHVKRLTAVSEPIWKRLTKEKCEHKFWNDNTLLVNSMSKTDFASQHFGFGERYVRTHCYGDWPGFMRCFKAPPMRQADGAWKRNEDVVWVFVRIPTEIHQRFMVMLAADLNSSEFPENVAARERDAQNRILRVKCRL